MLRKPAWHKRETLTRAQLSLLQQLADAISLTCDDRCRALGLDETQWRRWTDFLADGPLPAEPPLPEMLLRLAEVACNLTTLGGDRNA